MGVPARMSHPPDSRRPAAAARSPAELRFSALMWMLLHIPLILLLYSESIAVALDGIPLRYQAPLLVLYGMEAAVIVGLVYVAALPFSVAPRLFRFATPLLGAMMIVVLAIDSRLYASVGFHINGFFFKVVRQPGMLAEVGLGALELTALSGACAAWVALSLWIGVRFVHEFARSRGVIAGLAVLFALEVGDRLAVATLNFWGGPAVFAAGQVLPLQVRFTMNHLLSQWTGRPMVRDPLDHAARSSSAHLRPGASPDEVHLASRPDVIIALIESTRSDFLDSHTMPNLWRRSETGARFLRHYTAATATHYSVFSLFFSLQPQKLEAAVSGSRPPLLFDVLKNHGYQTRLITASSVLWMGMRETVFGSVEQELEADVQGRDGDMRDEAMLTRMRRFVTSADPARPLFLFLFFDGTHFSYSFPSDSEVFHPDWDGGSTIEAGRVAPELLRNRARNAAYEVDRKLEEFLRWYGAVRGGTPLVIVTGDHGEEYREHGRMGHGSAVTEEQVHVPLVMTGPGVPVGEVRTITTSLDIVPTIFALLGDTLPPERYSDGMSLFRATTDRFVVASVGWAPKYAVVGNDIKVVFSTSDAGLGSTRITDPLDRPLPDGDARFALQAPAILRAFTQTRP